MCLNLVWLLNLHASTRQSVTSRLETSRYRDFSQFFESIGLGLEKFWSQKKVLVSVSKIFGLKKKSRYRSRKYLGGRRGRIAVDNQTWKACLPHSGPNPIKLFAYLRIPLHPAQECQADNFHFLIIGDKSCHVFWLICTKNGICVGQKWDLYMCQKWDFAGSLSDIS